MKIFNLASVLGLAGVANASFDFQKYYDYTTDNSTKYISLTPKSGHSATMIYLHENNSSAVTSAYALFFKYQMAETTTKILIANGPIDLGSSKYGWWKDVASGSEITDSLGNKISGIQQGSNSVDAATTIILNLIKTELAALPSGKKDLANISVVGYQQGGALVSAVDVMYAESKALGFMINYDGWMPVQKSQWYSSNLSVQKQNPYLQLAGNFSTNAVNCDKGWVTQGYMQNNIYTGGYGVNLKWKTVPGYGDDLTAAIATIYWDATKSASYISGLSNSNNDCPNAPKATTTTSTDSADGVCLTAAVMTSFTTAAMSLY